MTNFAKATVNIWFKNGTGITHVSELGSQPQIIGQHALDVGTSWVMIYATDKKAYFYSKEDIQSMVIAFEEAGG